MPSFLHLLPDVQQGMVGVSGGSPQQLFVGHASSVPCLIGQCSPPKRGHIQQCVHVMICDVTSGVIQCTLFSF